MTIITTLFLSISLFLTHFSSTVIPSLHTAYVQTAGESNTNLQNEDALGLTCGSALLMEASTGAVIYEKNAAEQFRPASITKIMTLILIFDAIEEGRISLEDTVTVSEYASGMGGSQVYLEPGETQTVDTMIKCISVASANDACVSFKYSRHYFSYGF